METQVNNKNSCSFCQLLSSAKEVLTHEQTEFYNKFNEELDRLISYEEQIELTLENHQTLETLEEIKYNVKAAYNIYLETNKRLSYYQYLHNFHNAIHHYG